MMDRLRQVIRRFVAKEISYAEFRAEQVRFLAESDSDPLLELLYNSAESACSAFDNGHIDEGGLLSRLQRFITPVAVSANVATTIQAHQYVVYAPSHLWNMASAARNVENAPELRSPAGNPSSLESDLELEPA